MRNDSLPPSNKSRDSTKKIVGILSFLIVYKQSTLFLEKQMVASDFVFLRKKEKKCDYGRMSMVVWGLSLMCVTRSLPAQGTNNSFFFFFYLIKKIVSLGIIIICWWLHNIIRRCIACMLQLSANCTVYYMIWSPYITIIMQVILLVFFLVNVYFASFGSPRSKF